MTEGTDYGPAIAGLERMRDEIERTIATLRALNGMPVTEAIRSGMAGNGVAEFTNKHFFGLKAPAAVLLYLDTVKEARSATRIADDLMDHGFITTSGKPANTIRTTLKRLEESRQVVQVGKEWGLPGWYHGLRRPSRPEGETKPEEHTTRRRQSRKGRRKATKRARTVESKKAAPNAYQQFLAAQMASGKDMKGAAAAWQAQKAKKAS